MTKKSIYSLFCAIIVSVFPDDAAIAQNLKQEKMEQLNYLVGEWIGTSKVFENGVVTKEGAAYEKISYDLDKSILVIELNSEFLQLHTIVRYDEKEGTYFYHPFYKDGAAKYPAEFREGQLIVNPSADRRFIFRSTPEGGFQEYGEKLIDGKWMKYFEDSFMDTQ